MAPENFLHHSRRLSLNEQEKKIAETALENFANLNNLAPFSSDTKPFSKKSRNGVSMNILEFNGYQCPDPLFNSLYQQLELDQNGVSQPFRVLMIRRTKPDKSTVKMMAEENAHCHGVLYLAGIKLVDESLRKIEETQGANSIRFYSLDDDINHQASIKKINELVKPSALEYSVDLATNTISLSENLLSAATILLSGPYDKLLDGITDRFGDQASQILSSYFGDLLDMLTAAGDRIEDSLKNIKRPGNIIQYFGIATQSLKHLPDDVKGKVIEQAHVLKKASKISAQRLLTLGLTLVNTLTLSSLSEKNNSLVYFAPIAIINSLIISSYEVYERAKEYEKIEIDEKEFQKLISNSPLPLKKLYDKLPKSVVLALFDFSLNNYAVANIIGNLIVSAAVMPLAKINVPKEWIYTVSGIGDNVISGIVGTYLCLEDPYKRFIKRKFPRQIEPTDKTNILN